MKNKFPELAGINIDEHALTILNRAHEAVQVILKKRAAMDKDGKIDEPLRVYLGYDHQLPAHILHHMAVNAYMEQAGASFIFATEQQRSVLYKMWEMYCMEIVASRLFLPPGRAQSVLQDLQAADRKGHLSLNLTLATAWDYADHSMTSLFRYCIAQDIPCALTDTLFIKKGDQMVLDIKDAYTRASVMACMNTVPSEPIIANSQEGVHIRNHHMIVTAPKAPIIIQQTGDAHIAGFQLTHHPFETSLSRLSQDANHVFLAMPLSYKEFAPAHLPPHNLIEGENLFWQHGLPGINAVYNARKNSPLPNHKARIQRKEAEAAYVNAIRLHPAWAAIGLDKNILQLKDRWTESDKVRNNIISLFFKPGTNTLAGFNPFTPL
jgi:hypothetical protein